MQNIKLHEATKQFKLSNKLAMFFLEKKNIPVKSHSSTISMEQLELLREFSTDKDKFVGILDEFNKIERRNKSQKNKPAKKEKEIKKAEEKEIKKVEKREIKEEKKDIKVEIKKIKRPDKEEKKEEKIKEKVKRDIKTEKGDKVKKIKKDFGEKEKKPEKVEEEKSKEQEVKTKKKVEKVLEKESRKPQELDSPELIQVSNYITLKELSERLNLKVKYIEERMKLIKKEYLTNQMLDIKDIKEICKVFNIEVDVVSYEDYIVHTNIEKHNAKLFPRPPVVTVMGHVDHGKTTLLDTYRNTRIAEREKGGITQKIGAYKLTSGGKDIVFIDTPGHEAFTNIRARGAKITDIVILMVAADDGVKPQTIEAINHAVSAEVPIIVAINKIDKKEADADKVKQELTKHNVLVEDWGGDIVSVDISAKHNKNLDSLLEMITLVSEMQELKAYRGIPAKGTILESRLDSKLGPIGTVLIQEGQIKIGDFFICGNSVGKVKSMFDDWGKVLNSAEALLPIEIMGFEDVPEAGERFQVIDDIEKARKVIDLRKFEEKEVRKEGIIAEKKLSLQNLFEKLEESKIRVFPIVVKTDNFSSCEVIEKVLLKYSQEKLKINIVHKGIGHVTESDILLASTANAIIIGFNVKTSQKLLAIAKREKIEVKLYNVIYHLIEDVEKEIKGEIEPEYIETLIGTVEVLQKFKISNVGNIAGCIVKEGRITNKSKLRVTRNDDVVFEGDIQTLKRIKDEVKEVKAGTECGIKIKNFNDIEAGDLLEVYELNIKE